ncbi:MAG: hypothetical protein KDB27_25530 [Planctomycetales bacterium]|nr:hypothetical protein [Planctomycetales bacterium]
MNIFNWLKSRFSRRGNLLSLYRRGLARAKKHDHQGAIDDYSVAIDVPDAPVDVKAMALFNRALVHLASGDFTRGVDDLHTVLAMNEAPATVKKMARQKLAKRESRLRKANV